MPTDLKTETIDTLNKYSDFIEKKINESEDSILWFRGVGNTTYNLAPTLHRHPAIADAEKVIELEMKLMDRFNQRSIPFLIRQLDKRNDWEVLFFMQHYGIPTRLLDWSENPFIALYFALTSATYKIEKGQKIYPQDAGVWILDPVKWNRETLKDFSFTGGILSVEDHLIGGYRPRTEFAQMRDRPISIFGIHNSPRIVAQRGAFTVFGKKIKPMEEVYVEDNYPQDCLIKLVFPKDNIESLLHSLSSIGITDSVVFPDLEGLSKEIRRFFKFNIYRSYAVEISE